MSYSLADTTGVLEGFASIGGLRDFSNWAHAQTPAIRRFVAAGFSEDLDNLRVELEAAEPTPLVREQYDALIAAVKKADEIVILTDGMSDVEEPRTAGGQGSGNFGHAGRPGEVGGSGPGSGSGTRNQALGEVGGSATSSTSSGQIDFSTWTAGMTPELSASFEKESRKLYTQSFDDPSNIHETLTFLDTKTGRSLFPAPLQGGFDYVEVDDYHRIGVEMHENPKDLVAIHTHPSSSAFSNADFEQILEGRLGGGIVLGKNGHVYEIRINRPPRESEKEMLRQELALTLAEARRSSMEETDQYAQRTFGVTPTRFNRAEIVAAHPEIEKQHNVHWLAASHKAWEEFAKTSDGVVSYRRVPAKKAS